MVFELIENFLNWRKYKDNLVLDKYILQTSTKKELMSKDIKIKNYIMTKKINDFLDFRPNYFNKFRAKKNILLEQFYELLGDYLIENSYYSIKKSFDLTINDFKKDVLVKEIIRDLVIIEFENKQCLLYFGNYQNVDVKELGDYVMKEHTQFVIFKLNMLEVYSLEELQTYFGLQFRQTNTLRIIDKIIKLFSRQQQIKNIGNQEEKFTALFSKNNINSLKQFEFEKYLYFNENYKIKHTDIVNLSSVGSTGCLLGVVTIKVVNEDDIIEDIKIKDLNNKKNFKVLSYNLKSKKLEICNVRECWSNGIKQTYKLYTQHNKTIIGTSNHPFMKIDNETLEIKKTRLDELKFGDMLYMYDEKHNKSYIDYVNGFCEYSVEETYNMEVEENHTYIANDFHTFNSGKTYTLNLLLLQILFGGNFRRIIYFDTQNSFNETMMNNVNPIYMNRCKYLNESYFQITDENFYLNELDFVMSVNFLLEVKGYGGADAKASVVKVEYDDHESFKQAVSEILSLEKNKLSVFKDLNKLEDLDSIDKFMKKVKIRKQGSIFDDLETRKQFFAIFTFQDTFFYEVACYLYLQKFKDILYNREDKYTYLFADETQKYLGGAFLKKILLDLVKEKRQFGFRFFYTGLSYNDVNDFMRFTRHRVFNSFNDVFMLNTLKSLSNTPIENIKMPLEKIIHNNDTSEIKKTELDLNLISKEKTSRQLLESDKFELTDEEKEEVENKLEKHNTQEIDEGEFTEL